MATALNPYIGYDRATAIVKDAAASGRTLREVAREHGVDEKVLDEALDLRTIAAGTGRTSMMDVLVLATHRLRAAGRVRGRAARARRADHRVELDEGEPLPAWRGFDAIVAMGGPMSVNDEDEFTPGWATRSS